MQMKVYDQSKQTVNLLWQAALVHWRCAVISGSLFCWASKGPAKVHMVLDWQFSCLSLGLHLPPWAMDRPQFPSSSPIAAFHSLSADPGTVKPPWRHISCVPSTSVSVTVSENDVWLNIYSTPRLHCQSDGACTLACPSAAQRNSNPEMRSPTAEPFTGKTPWPPATEPTQLSLQGAKLPPLWY